jgi:hypothetical protein
MATTFEWIAPESIATLITSGMDALANGSYSSAGTLDNEAGLYTFINFELYLASLTPVAGQTAAIYISPSLDGTNYADANQIDTIVVAFPLSTSTSAKRKVAANIMIPPLKLSITVGNLTITSGVAFAANSNTLKYRRHNGQGV